MTNRCCVAIDAGKFGIGAGGGNGGDGKGWVWAICAACIAAVASCNDII